MSVGGVSGAREPDRSRPDLNADLRTPDVAANDTGGSAPPTGVATEVAADPVTVVPAPEIVEDARTIARADEAAMRAHLESGFDVPDPAGEIDAAIDPEVPFGQTLTGLSFDAATYATGRLAELGGLEQPRDFGAQTLGDYEVRRQAERAGDLGLRLDAARAAGDVDAAALLETQIADRFGDNGLPAIDAAIEAANEAGPRPEFFASRSGFHDIDPYSAAMTEALTPLATESLYRDHIGHDEAAALDAAYANLSPDVRAQLDAEIDLVSNDRNFFEGAWQAIEDTGTDVIAIGELALRLSTDSAARAEFADNARQIADALGDPERRAEALGLIGSELGEGLVEAFTNFENDPDYYSGYLAGTVAAGGGLGRLARVGAVAARLGGTGLDLNVRGLFDTRPTLTPDPSNRPQGRPTQVPDNERPENIRALTRENESAQLLAQLGYDIRQNPDVPGSANPDYLIDGRLFDNFAPQRDTSARNIWSVIQGKVEHQAPGIVLNLDDSAIDIADLRAQFDEWPIEGLEQLIVIRDGAVIPFRVPPVQVLR